MMPDPSPPTQSPSPEHFSDEISALRKEAMQLRELLDRLSAIQVRSSETTRRLLGVLDAVVRQQQEQAGSAGDPAQIEELIRTTVSQEVRLVLDARAETGGDPGTTRRRLPRLQPWINVGLILLLILSAAAGYWLLARWPDPFRLSSSNLVAHDSPLTMGSSGRREPSDRPEPGPQAEPSRESSAEPSTRTGQKSLPLPAGAPEAEGPRSSATTSARTRPSQSEAKKQAGTVQGTSMSPGASTRTPLLITPE